MIKTKEERQRILESCHSEIGGKSKPLLLVLFSSVVVVIANFCLCGVFISCVILLQGAHDKTYKKVAKGSIGLSSAMM